MPSPNAATHTAAFQDPSRGNCLNVLRAFYPANSSNTSGTSSSAVTADMPHTSTVSCASGLSSEALSKSGLLRRGGSCLSPCDEACCRGGLPESVVMICPGCLTPTCTQPMLSLPAPVALDPNMTMSERFVHKLQSHDVKDTGCHCLGMQC